MAKADCAFTSRYMLVAASDLQAHVSRGDLEGHVRHYCRLLGLLEASLARLCWRELGCRQAPRLLAQVEDARRKAHESA